MQNIRADISTMRFDNLGFHYDESHELFNHISLDLPSDQVVWIRGDRGQGQSTLLKLISAMLQPTSGEYIINGKNTSQMSFEEFMPFRLRIGVGFDYGGLFANRTLFENLVLGPNYHRLRPTREVEREARLLAEEFGFADELTSRPASVPGGLRKLTCVLRPLLMQPSMLVLDDPTTGLDSESSDLLYRILLDKWVSKSIRHIFFSSRDRRWAELFSTRVINVTDLYSPKKRQSAERLV